MQLTHIDIANLSISAFNMRDGKAAPDTSDLLPSVRARGVLVPLLVRRNGSPESYEIVAGRRRYHAALALREECGEPSALPCALLDEGDDAAALEASLLENFARVQPHEVELWESFTRLVKEGKTPEEVALMFALTLRQVEQILALGNLLPKLRKLYARNEIDAASIRLLTMASMKQQKDWLALFADPQGFAPTGMRLKAWLFGGASIPTSQAIFDLDAYEGEIVTDLFGEERYFASPDRFWAAQRAAIEARRQGYLDAGWADVIILEPGTYFHSWDHEKRSRAKGGKVFIAIGARGEVAFHEGFLTRAEARRLASGAAAGEESKPQRSELSASLLNYADLHRHAAVRTHLLGAPHVALRLLVAHAIAGSPFVAVRPDPRRPASDAVADSTETSLSETRFDAARREALAMLDLDGESTTLLQGYGYGGGSPDLVTALFLKLLGLDEAKVMSLVALVMGEALAAGSPVIEALGFHLGVDLSKLWQPDEAFYGLLRDKELLGAMVAELAGPEVAAANAKEKASGLKSIVRDCLSGSNGRGRVHGWVPKFMRFPPAAYTPRGGLGPVQLFAMIKPLLDARAEQAVASDDESARETAVAAEQSEEGSQAIAA